MFFKAINDLMDSNRLVLILLIFGTYFKMSELDALSASIIQRTIALKKTINEVWK